jgi:putative sterol carrier protein
VGGRVTAAAEGAPDAPDVTFTLAAADAAALADGGVAPTVAFMRGRLKTAGDPGLVLALLAAADAGPFARWVDALRAG